MAYGRHVSWHTDISCYTFTVNNYYRQVSCFVTLLFTFNVSFFQGIGPFLTGVKILQAVMN